MAPVLEGKINWFRPKNSAKKGELLIWRSKNQARDHHGVVVQLFRIQFASNQSKLVPRKLNPGTSF
jgi:hypothetical protein